MTKYTAFRCPEDLLAKAKSKAQRDRRSLSNYLITLIEKDVSEQASSEDEPIVRNNVPPIFARLQK